MTDVAYVADATLAAGRAPDRAGWRARLGAALFSSRLNTAITLVLALLIAAIAVPFLSWALVEATWSGGPEACRAARQGACWSFIATKFNFILFGFYPAEDHWRPGLALVISVALVVAAATPRFWSRALIGVWVAGIAAILILMHGGVFGLAVHPTRSWGGLPLTVVLSLVGLSAAFPLGILLALGRRSELPLIRNFCICYIELLRGVPLITILFMASVLFPLLLPEGAVVDKLLRAQIALILFGGAYIAEVVRGGLQAIPSGQYEAAASLGLGYRLTMAKIILPQALKIVIPPLVSIAIGFFKDTSLVIIIGLFDFLSTIKATLNDADWIGFHVEAYLFAAMVYFSVCFTFSRYSLWLEKRLSPENTR